MSTKSKLAEIEIEDPTEEVVAEQSATTSVMVFENGDYVRKELPVEEARAASVQIIRDAYDRGSGSRLQTHDYNPDMHRCWISNRKDDPATMAAIAKGYVPCREKDAAKRYSHDFGKVEGWDGDVVHHGDSILVHIPKLAYEAREERRLDQIKKRRADARASAVTSIEEVTNGRFQGEAKVDSGYEQEIMRPGDVGRGSSGDYNESMASSIVEAQMRAMGNAGHKIQQQGFRSSGGAGNDTFIPESPNIARLLAKRGL